MCLYVKAQLQFIEGIQQQLRKEKAENLALEAHVRDEVTKEFSELISQMQEDYRSEITRFRVQLCVIITNYRSCFMMTLTPFCVFFYFSERISRERELIEERCERRLEILKNLVGKTAVEDDSMVSAATKSEVQICFQNRYSKLYKYFL